MRNKETKNFLKKLQLVISTREFVGYSLSAILFEAVIILIVVNSIIRGVDLILCIMLLSFGTAITALTLTYKIRKIWKELFS